MTSLLNKNDIVGTWELEEFEQLGPEGLCIRSLPESRGLLIYTEEGSMSVSMYRVPDTLDEAVLRNFPRDLYYAGSYKIEGEFILHEVKVALLEQHRGQSLVRKAHLEGELLSLEALSVEGRVLGKIVWRRLRAMRSA